MNDIEATLRESWGPDTAYPGTWNPDVPENGQCAVTALVVQERLGGLILRGEYDGGSHYWNRLDAGTEIDFTAGQFPDPVERRNVSIRTRESLLDDPDTDQRYTILRLRYAANILGAMA